MPIPEQQLATWSHQGAITASKATHEAIRCALRRWDAIHDRNYDVYLQGSYKNSTNIRGSSDVDVVAQINDVFHSNKNDLPFNQRDAHDREYSQATYRLEHFRQDVLDALRNHFGSHSIVEGNKAITVRATSGRLPADVVVCAQLRQYSYFFSRQNQDWLEGMTFWTRDRRQITNYPKPHYDNGVRKNDECTRSYKAGVRVFKNARDTLALKQASRARVASFGCASWHKANLGAAQRTMSQVARDEMACAKRTFGTFPHRFRL